MENLKEESDSSGKLQLANTLNSMKPKLEKLLKKIQKEQPEHTEDVVMQEVTPVVEENEY